MPFDAATEPALSALEREIVSLAAKRETQALLRTFSPWTVRPARGRNARSPYVLERAKPDAGRPDGEFYLTNLVLQGGGMLGLAHAGLIRGLELAGFRFAGLAGTSAGAILVMGGFAARGPNLLDPMSDQVKAIIDNAPMADFVDGPRQIRRLLKRFAGGKSVLHPMMCLGAWQAIRRLLTQRGLNPGHVFEAWTRDRLAELGVTKIADLRQIADTLANDLKNASPRAAGHPFRANKTRAGLTGDDPFKIISTAMPTGMRFELPKDLRLLSHEYGDVTPARLLRMSMSIPLFFEPVRMAVHRQNWQQHVANGPSRFVSDKGAMALSDLKKLTFLDGGLISNLPTDALVANISDEIPTISVPLVQSRPPGRFRRATRPGSFLAEVVTVANTLTLQGDHDAHTRFQEQGHTNRIAWKIDTGTINWLDFSMPDEKRENLFRLGLERVHDALEKGDF